ncbi:MAG: hypothetical protein K0Q79_960 [Flavipsychrobacter sp.]|jgi:hypothetical protein|nr:hypothetical protein [Flavipsychrobacter sp.]
MKKVIAVFAFILFVGACQKPANNAVTGGGKGGNVTIRIIPELYDEFVDTCTIYVKYGSLDAPASGVYDDSIVCTVANDTPSATFTNLKVGLYYFFGKGWHSGAGHLPNVKGSKNCTISADGTNLFYLPTFSYTP